MFDSSSVGRSFHIDLWKIVLPSFCAFSFPSASSPPWNRLTEKVRLCDSLTQSSTIELIPERTPQLLFLPSSESGKERKQRNKLSLHCISRTRPVCPRSNPDGKISPLLFTHGRELHKTRYEFKILKLFFTAPRVCCTRARLTELLFLCSILLELRSRKSIPDFLMTSVQCSSSCTSKIWLEKLSSSFHLNFLRSRPCYPAQMYTLKEHQPHEGRNARQQEMYAKSWFPWLARAVFVVSTVHFSAMWCILLSRSISLRCNAKLDPTSVDLYVEVAAKPWTTIRLGNGIYRFCRKSCQDGQRHSSWQSKFCREQGTGGCQQRFQDSVVDRFFSISWCVPTSTLARLFLMVQSILGSSTLCSPSTSKFRLCIRFHFRSSVYLSAHLLVCVSVSILPRLCIGFHRPSSLYLCPPILVSVSVSTLTCLCSCLHTFSSMHLSAFLLFCESISTFAFLCIRFHPCSSVLYGRVAL